MGYFNFFNIRKKEVGRYDSFRGGQNAFYENVSSNQLIVSNITANVRTRKRDN